MKSGNLNFLEHSGPLRSVMRPLPLPSLVFVYDALGTSDHMAATTARLVGEFKEILEGTGHDTIEVTSWHLSKERILKFCAGVPLNEN